MGEQDGEDTTNANVPTQPRTTSLQATPNSWPPFVIKTVTICRFVFSETTNISLTNGGIPQDAISPTVAVW